METTILGTSFGEARATSKTSDINKRLDHIEEDIDALWNRFSMVKDDIKKLRTDAEEGLQNATAKLQEAEQRHHEKLEEAVIGGIHLELYGLGFLLLGITFATIPTEVALLLQAMV
ncbi:hypothetical protein [Pelagibius sp. 7325]|uniref:hypothetical protein n=1 Tax=Pelagibius sp. 7325 TaxID=3131994 RepID=UPI0030EB7475